MSILRYETSPACFRQRTTLSATTALSRLIGVLSGTTICWMIWLVVIGSTSSSRLATLLMGGLVVLPVAGAVLLLGLVSWPLALRLRYCFSIKSFVVLLLSALGQALLGLYALAVWQMLTEPTAGDFHF
ncbi:hypothetical protein [Hymenobacter jeollabukensis]|uniref:Uncharacterized protein n=1 Tax=Hymenobacter jeollabukensis TaxID=2025313 RepID=A0A5R8WQV5_9BACT|nr:hypothetical protein [Hymenobacter jeollabukensis]TLM92341.1 hypothetical protein FDY95_12975 [Hymenobacter jeollabukensis]